MCLPGTQRRPQETIGLCRQKEDVPTWYSTKATGDYRFVLTKEDVPTWYSTKATGDYRFVLTKGRCAYLVLNEGHRRL